MEGERRPLRVPLGGVDVTADGGDLVLAFSLPKGSYATSVLREVMKTEPTGA
jgi:tRNA pseudouridine13 synthase